MKTKIKVVVQTKKKDVPGWPHINYDYDKETASVLTVLKAHNSDIDFDVFRYTHISEAEASYPEDLKKYDGVLVLLMTNWINLDVFYARKAKEGLPCIIADIPFCGSGSVLVRSIHTVREEHLPVPVIASANFNDIAKAVRVFVGIKKVKQSRILVVSNNIDKETQSAAKKIWGCTFINCNSEELMKRYHNINDTDAKVIKDKWISQSEDILEATNQDVSESAKLYLAIMEMYKEKKADAVTIDCLSLSYNDIYGNNLHMYPCLAFFQMCEDGYVGVCEADIDSTITSIFTKAITGRYGFVSDPVIDTSSNQIIYAHCVSCRKLFGEQDKRLCKYYIRSHAEDKKGAAVQVIFPANEQLTTVNINNVDKTACIHSAVSVGNYGGDAGCRSKLAALCKSEEILNNWMPQWHRVTIFGNYTKEFVYLFKMMGFNIITEDK